MNRCNNTTDGFLEGVFDWGEWFIFKDSTQQSFEWSGPGLLDIYPQRTDLWAVYFAARLKFTQTWDTKAR
jgi:hypothetical protein